MRLKFIGTSLLRQTVDIEADAGQSLLVGIEDDWRDQAVVSSNGNVDVDVVEPGSNSIEMLKNDQLPTSVDCAGLTF